LSCIPKQLDSSKKLHMGIGSWPHTGLSPSMTFCSKKLRPDPNPKTPLQITTRAPKEPDFKSELMPLHSPLLRQSQLVSFPPLIDMLKFSGYPYLIRGQKTKSFGVLRAPPEGLSGYKIITTLPHSGFTASDFQACLSWHCPSPSLGLEL
jgi:hypothetical protein